MNNPNPKLRYALGISALTALSLAMVGCGGSSSSAPAAAVNASPTAPIVAFSGGQQITGHPSFYTLTSTDPEGDTITYSVTGTGASVTGNTVTLNTATAGSATFSATATDSHGNHSAATNQTVTIAANRAPQFISQANGELHASTSTIAWNTFQVVSQDPDGDDVRYAVTGTPTFTDNNGNAATGAIAINATTGLVSFTGTVPSGATSVTATFTVTSTDQLVGSGTVLGPASSQVISLTFFNNNLPPVILTSSLPPLPLNHYIPTTATAAGFALDASDPNASDVASLTWTMTSSYPGLVLSSATGAHTTIVTNSAFVPLTSTSTPVSVTVTVTDQGGLSTTRTLSIPLVADSVPTLNSNVYTETVSGVVAFDSSRVKNDITGSTRSKFYPGDIDWVGFGQYAGNNYVGALESTGGIDALATDNAFSNYAGAYPAGFLGALTDDTLPAKGWNARTIFKDNEGDGITYSILPGSVFVAGTPWNVVGQTFTLSPVTLPNIPGGVWPGINPDLSEYPMVDVSTGTIQWRPIATSEIAFGGPVGGTPPFLAPLTDNLGFDVWSQPSVWSFIVQANENVYVPPGNTPVAPPSNQGQQQYVIKVQPNNAPTIGPLTTIPNAQLTVPGALANQVVNPLTTISIGGGASSSATAYGRPSIQEPESKRYDQASGTGFDYAAPNTAKPAIWRWLMARPGGNIAQAADVQIYDGDQTTTTGHQDTIFAAMGVPTIPAADTTNNVPALSASSASFYNPWLTAGDAGAFQVNWGPNRTQYLIARVTASAAYAFPVEVRDQYERINNGNLNINPIFGTVRFTNARTRVVGDAAAELFALKRGSTLLSGANPGDPTIGSSRYTFTYLPFPDDSGSGDETSFGTFFFQGSNPASGTTGVTGLYTAASWITLNAREAPYTSYHTGNPLNDESGTFNLPAYASAYDGTSSSSSRADWKTYGYTYVNGANPSNPAVEDRNAIGSWANHEVRAQVIPSNSPYLFTFSTTLVDIGYLGNGPLNRFPNELMSSTTQMPLQNNFSTLIPANVGPTGAWYDLPVLNGGSGGGGIGALAPAFAHSWVYNLYQGEVDMQNAAPGRGVSLPVPFDATTLRWTYSWPTQVTNSNLGVTTGGVNNWAKGDVMQIAVPNQRTNSRYFFVGDGSANDPNAANIYGWGGFGITVVDPAPPVVDTDLVVGTAVANPGFTGLIKANNTPFHVPSNSLWIYNNFMGTGTTGFLNTPNRTTFSPGASSTQVPYGVAARGYIDNNIAGAFNLTDPGYIVTYPSGNALPALLDLTQGDNTYFLWLKQDGTVKTAWGTWDASAMVPGSTYTATGGTTTVPAFAMTAGINNSTLPPSFLSDAQISMATGAIPGQNHAANVDVKTDPSLYNANIVNAKGWTRSEWGLAAPTMGYQPLGSTNVRLVNPDFDSTIAIAAGAHSWDNLRGNFHVTNAAQVSRDGGVRDSAIVYGVRRHTNENGGANAELGLAGIEPGSPMLAQWYNVQTASDIALDASTVASTNMTDIGTAWPKVFNFYSPFSGNAAWANVMEYKVNFLVGVTYPDANAADPTNVSTNTLWKVPAQMANVFPLGAAVTDPTCTNPANTINPGNPIVRPIQFLRITDFVANTTPGVFNTTLDLVTSSPTNAASGLGAMVLGGNTYIQARSNVKLTFQASVNNQVIPSGYIVDIFLLNGTVTTTAQPVLLGSVRSGHIGGRDAIQNLFLPSMHSYSGLDGNGVPQNAVYFFRVRTVWNQGINFEKQPNKQSIPMAYADYISAPFVTN